MEIGFICKFLEYELWLLGKFDEEKFLGGKSPRIKKSGENPRLLAGDHGIIDFPPVELTVSHYCQVSC